MTNEAEDQVSKFYNTVGWKTEGGITEDAARWEDLRDCAKEYVSKCRLRVLRHIPESGENILDMASGPIQYEEYLEYSSNFNKRYCVDLSSRALEAAKTRIGDHGVFLQGSFFDIPLEENFFDCAISLHTIYHIDKDSQEKSVRKLIEVTKPGKPVIVVYSNPAALIRLIKLPSSVLRRASSSATKRVRKKGEGSKLYFHSHSIEWWNRFSDVATVSIFPWRSFDANVQKALIPNNKVGKKMFGFLFDLEERFPDFFAKHLQYPMIVLTKKRADNEKSDGAHVVQR